LIDLIKCILLSDILVFNQIIGTAVIFTQHKVSLMLFLLSCAGICGDGIPAAVRMLFRPLCVIGAQ